MTAALDDRLAELVADAIRRLDDVSGGTAVCAFTRAGTPVPGIKYAEGRWAALREVQRAFRRGPTAPAADASDVASILGTALHTWRVALDRAVVGSGPDWVAYRTGGVDALSDLTP